MKFACVHHIYLLSTSIIIINWRVKNVLMTVSVSEPFGIERTEF